MDPLVFAAEKRVGLRGLSSILFGCSAFSSVTSLLLLRSIPPKRT
jgi:hypothetical protein